MFVYDMFLVERKNVERKNVCVIVSRFFFSCSSLFVYDRFSKDLELVCA